MMVNGVSRVIDGARSAAGLVEAAVRLAVESAAVKWCAFLVAGEAEGRWQVMHGGGVGAPAAGTVLSMEDMTALDNSDPDSALFFRPASRDATSPGRTGIVFARQTPAGGGPPGSDLDASITTQPEVAEDPLHEALSGLFAHVHALLDHLPGHADPPDAGVAGLMADAQIKARLEEEIARARRYGGSLSILLIDVDETGTAELEASAHGTGNVVRRQVQRIIAESLVQHMRQMDCTGRHGADAFLVILPETGAEEALNAGVRFGQLIGQAIEGHVASLGADEVPAFELRCGVTTFPVAAQTADELLLQAEGALATTRAEPVGGWLRHALPHLNQISGRGFRCICRRCGKVFEVDDRAHQRARRFCSHACYVADRREGEQGRDSLIREARATGASLRELAKRFGLSAERVRQICQPA